MKSSLIFCFILTIVLVFIYSCNSSKSNTKDFDKNIEDAILLKDKSNYSEALLSVNKAIEIDESKSFAFVLKGQIESCLEQDQQALKSFSEAVSLNPRNISAYYHRGMSFYVLDKDSAAVSDYTKALTIKQSNSDGYFEKIETRHLDIQDQIDVPVFELRYFRGLSLLHLKKYPEAVDDFLYSLFSNYKNVDCDRYIGICYLNTGRKVEACDYLNKASLLGDTLAIRLHSTFCSVKKL